MGLAERRQKSKIPRDPSNTAWSSGENVGKRLLKKAGWHPGLGLGKSNHGRVKTLSFFRKDNVLGVGANPFDVRDEHTKNYERLLMRLNGVQATEIKEEGAPFMLGNLRFVRGPIFASEFKKETDNSDSNDQTDDNSNYHVDNSDSKSLKKKIKSSKRAKRVEKHKVKGQDNKVKKDKRGKIKKDRKDDKRENQKKNKDGKTQSDKNTGGGGIKNDTQKVLSTIDKNHLENNNSRSTAPLRLHHRAKNLAMKRASTMDATKLNEIFGRVG